MMISDKNFHAQITKLSYEGRGIAHRDGKVQLIDNALPNEEVIFHHLKTHAKYDEGLATEIIKANPHRVEPPCP